MEQNTIKGNVLAYKEGVTWEQIVLCFLSDDKQKFRNL
jgi:hypothetical protein